MFNASVLRMQANVLLNLRVTWWQLRKNFNFSKKRQKAIKERKRATVKKYDSESRKRLGQLYCTEILSINYYGYITE